MGKIEKRFGAHIVTIKLRDNDPVEKEFSNQQKLDRLLFCLQKAIDNGEFKKSFEQSKY